MSRISLVPTAFLGAAMLVAWISDASAQPMRKGMTANAVAATCQKHGEGVAGGEEAGARSLLREAEAALNRGEMWRANVALEQAQTRLLTRSVDPSRIGTSASGGLIGDIASARQAVTAGNRAEAHQRIRLAMASLDREDGLAREGGSVVVVPGAAAGTTVIVP